MPTISSGETVTISGVAGGYTIAGGGELIVTAGGAVTGTVVSNGATIDVQQGGLSTSAAVKNGGSLIVESGGDADTTFLSGGSATVDSGGTIGAGGLVFAKSGGLLVLDPGAVVSGNVTSAANTSNNTLELASGTAVGIISGLDAQIAGMGAVKIDGGGTWEVAGITTLDSSVVVTNRGVISEASGDTLTIDGSLTGAGSIILDPSTLILNGAVGSGQTVHFAGNGGDLLELGNASAFAGSLAGFGNHDSIDLTGIAVTGTTFDSTSGVLTVSDAAGTFTIDFNGDLSGHFFHTTVDGSGGTIITQNTACYVRGTLIETDRGEVPVEDLAIGDLVQTLSGGQKPIKWIGRRSYGGRFLTGQRHAVPIRIRANALADGVPKRDLRISPQHAMYLDGMLVEGKDLVNGVTIVRDAVDRVDYTHVEFADHELIWADGALSESFVDDESRGLFANADEFSRLYPDEAKQPARYCAPRAGEGAALEAIRQRLAERAGIGQIAPSAELRGFIDCAGPNEVRGWAQDPSHPEVPVHLDVWVDGQRVAQVLAKDYREDLAEAGLGSGRHAFVLPLHCGSASRVEVRRSIDQKPLPGPEYDRRAA